jgi:hypothetical protein
LRMAMRVEGGTEVGSRGRIAAAGFLVASGLLAGGASNAVAHAAPAPDSVDADEGDGGTAESGQKIGPNSRPRAGAGNERSTGTEAGEHRPVDQKPQGPESEKPVGVDPHDGDEGVGEGPVTAPGGPVREEPPTKEEPEVPEEPEDCWPWWPPSPDPEPPPPGGGGGGDQPGRPSGRPQMPRLQLPSLLRPENTPSQPDVIDAEPGVGITASDTAVAPITLPIVVALPGAGAPRGLPTEPVPRSPRSSAAEPAAGRQAPPAESASNVGVPPASYRAGYTDYLRSAGISQIAALAAPGLAGMLILTGLGGLLGYRQAKAGRALRTGAAARFVN